MDAPDNCSGRRSQSDISNSLKFGKLKLYMSFLTQMDMNMRTQLDWDVGKNIYILAQKQLHPTM